MNLIYLGAILFLIDREKKYIYVATMYPISEKKINSKLQSGKIIDIREDIEMVESYII